MTRLEWVAKMELEREGYTVLRNGWPDFLAHRTDADGARSFLGVEVKGPADPVRPCQTEMILALNQVGLHTEIWRAPGIVSDAQVIADFRRADYQRSKRLPIPISRYAASLDRIEGDRWPK